jgi:hypothetical protein
MYLSSAKQILPEMSTNSTFTTDPFFKEVDTLNEPLFGLGDKLNVPSLNSFMPTFLVVNVALLVGVPAPLKQVAKILKV